MPGCRQMVLWQVAKHENPIHVLIPEYDMRHFSGEFTGIRVLFEDELEQISGGKGNDTDDVAELPPVIVKAADSNNSHTTYYMPFDWSFGGPSMGTLENPEPSDEDAIHVKINFDRPLTEAEQKNLDDLNAGILRITKGVDNIPDNYILTMDGGRTISGKELKQLWVKTDFEINELGHEYANGLKTGEADYNNGNPVVRFNIDTLGGL